MKPADSVSLSLSLSHSDILQKGSQPACLQKQKQPNFFSQIKVKNQMLTANPVRKFTISNPSLLSLTLCSGNQ